MKTQGAARTDPGVQVQTLAYQVNHGGEPDEPRRCQIRGGLRTPLCLEDSCV